MNEVTQIHLGRQAYTISIEAHRALKIYIEAIKKQVGDTDVVDEVELRMSELLSEHGVNGDKVILLADVNYLKEQLGNPNDFKDDDTSDNDASVVDADKPASKRLFRDTDNAILAGVASGIAQYFNVSTLAVRILFVFAILSGGWGILLYVALWLLVPEAKTSSDRLQMAGKEVTVESLKELVERADVKGAAHRANSVVGRPIHAVIRLILKLVGIVFIVAGLTSLLGIIAGGIYLSVHGTQVFQDSLFPVGFRENLLVIFGMGIAAIISLFIILFGLATVRRKWPIRGWVTGGLIGIALLGLAATMGLAGDVAPAVRDRYNAHMHTSVRNVTPFTNVEITGARDLDINYNTAETYSVTLSYFDNPTITNIKTNVLNGVLVIDAQQFDENRHCKDLCIPDDYNMVITINAPNADQLRSGKGYPLLPTEPTPPDEPPVDNTQIN